MKNLAVITARSGSKGLIDKNIKNLNGKPLIWYSINAARESGCFDEIMVSTDSDVYKEIALECGAAVPFLRSKENSGNEASSWDAVREVVNNYAKHGCFFDTVALLQPTSPLRNAEHIKDGYALFCEKKADAVIGVVEMEHSPLWANTLPPDKNMKGFLKEEVYNTPRQSLDTYYRINGALYIVKTAIIEHLEKLYGDKSYAYVMEQNASIDIDTESDFKIAQILMGELKV